MTEKRANADLRELYGYTCMADIVDHKVGEEIITLLGLKNSGKTGRVNTAWGDKSPCGLARTIRALFDEVRT